MKKRILILLTVWLAELLIGAPAQAQMLRDTTFFNMACRGVDCIYDFRFAEAHDIYRKIESAYPEHPMTFIFKGLLTYWESYPLTKSSEATESYIKTLKQAVRLCDKNPSPEDKAEYLLANLGARGLLLLFYADNNQQLDIISMAPGTYALVRKAFDYTKAYADFFFFTGLYNYYREAYPRVHPFYKPFALLFPGGDEIKGLSELRTASENSIVLKAEAYTFLANIYINYENDYQRGLSSVRSLTERYPGNSSYLSSYIWYLFLNGQYDEAEKLVSRNQQKTNNAYFRAQLPIFDGILSENKYHDIRKAEECYRLGINKLGPFSGTGNNFIAYAYLRLSRISELNGNLTNKNFYLKKAKELGY